MKQQIIVMGLLFLSTFSTLAQIEDQTEEKEKWSIEDLPFVLTGFVHTRHAIRIKNDPYQSKAFPMSETRFRVGLNGYNDLFEWNLKSDFIYDSFDNKGKIDLREANLIFNTPYWISIKLGRQILTWGKGDMLFINDLFPKDWQSFFIGRELEYLKAPSNALKVSLYFAKMELNMVYSPSFDSDNFPRGNRLSFFDLSIADFRGDDDPFEFDVPNAIFRQDEFTWRLRRNIGSADLALYGYYGYWKSPSGFDLSTGIPQFNSLTSHGLSFESKLWKGIFSTEMAYYHSSQDSDGDDFAIANSSFRYIVGQNFSLKNEWNLAFQYYGEYIINYAEQEENWPMGLPIPPRVRDMITVRIGKNLLNQRLNLSLFNYWGIAERDNYLRFNASYKLNDDWKIDMGGNIFSGRDDFSFWNQFNHNSNVYLGLKWSY